MYKKKEILIVIVIIVIAIFIILINQPTSNATENIITNNYVTVSISGEVKEEASVKIPKGHPLSFAISRLESYFNDYSIRDYDLYMKINEDTNIVIKTKDLNNSYNEESTNVNINTADISSLTTLYGIGEARAKRIIASREITSFEELKKLLGVSDYVITKIKEQAIL